MNILTNYPNVSLVTTNPATDSVVRDNAVRPVIPPATAPATSNASPTVASEQEKAQPAVVTPNNNPTYDLPANQVKEQAESSQQGQPHDEEGKEQHQQDKQGDEHKHSQDKNERYTEEEQKQISELKLRDAEVVAHEQAHAGVGGQYAGSPTYSYQTGPDGAKYAVGGEVSIDTSKVPNDPQATLLKAQIIKRAALAPVEPSSQDRRVAAKADQMASQARQDMLAENKDSGDDNDYRVNGEVKSDSFGRRIELAQDDSYQESLQKRTHHINNYYQQSSQVAQQSALNQQV